MRIDSYNKLLEANRVSAVGGKSAPGQSAEPESVAGETVNLSAAAQELAEKADAVKIGNLRDAIENGTYKPDPQAIARRLVEGG